MKNFTHFSFFFILLWQHLPFSSSNFTFISLAKTKIIPGLPFKIVTFLSKSDNPPVSFTFELINYKNESIFLSDVVQIAPLESKVTILNIPKESLPDFDKSYKLTVTAKDAKDNLATDLIFIDRDSKNSSILIQTDKPIYKPGEFVKFRVLVLNRFFQPFGFGQDKSKDDDGDKLVHITILDPKRNIIKLWKSARIPPEKGFISEQFELSKEPVLGDWSIQVETGKTEADPGSEEQTHRFSVEEYVLPKYKVEVKTSPKFVTFNEPKFVAEVSALYSYGKVVNGECTLELRDPSRAMVQQYYPWTHYVDGRLVRKNDGQDEEEGLPQAITKTSKLNDGKIKIEFNPKTELLIPREEATRWGKELNIFVSCKDQSSGNVRNATTSIKMYEFPFKIELVKKPNNIIPGFQVNLTIKVARHDEVPVSDENPEALMIEHGFKMDEHEGILKLPIPANGLVQVTFMAATNPKVCYESLDVTYKGLKESLWLPGKFVSKTGSYIQTKVITTEELIEGKELEVNIKTSKRYDAINILMISRGLIIHSEVIKGNSEKEQNFKIKMPPKSSPKVKLFIYVILEDGNLVSSEHDLEVKDNEVNKLIIGLDRDKLELGDNVTISLKGHQRSHVAIRAVDQSVLLLREDNDLTMEKLGNVADVFSAHQGWWNGGGEVLQNFLKNGLDLMTNLVIIEKNDRKEKLYHRPRKGGRGGRNKMAKMSMAPNAGFAMAAPDMEMSADDSGDAGGGEVEVRLRSNFPETWIWEDFENPEGSVTLHKQVPDTITSWLISAFQINQEHGLALASQSQKLTVFRPFFIALNLPYSVVKGEVLLLQILVHNYMEQKVTAKVTLDNKEGSFKFLESQENFDKIEKEVEISGSSINSVVIPIVPSKFGVITFNVKAVTKVAGDAISQTLIVRPPGIKHQQNSAILVNLLKERTFKKVKISAIFPEERVPDADFLKVQVIGDILGGTLNNLDKLIKLPTGCAEQAMLNFVHNLVILNYLNATGQHLPELEAKAKSFLEKGYQHQLSYLRSDGSYSAFGSLDQTGSTWLTAYVTRALIQARKYIYIDGQPIVNSLRFLTDKQNDNGSFTEEGFVYDSSLQGGQGKAKRLVPITAYTLLTIAEAEKANIDLKGISFKNKSGKQILKKGINFLIKQTRPEGGNNKPFTKAYQASLIAYLLHYVNHEKKDEYFKILENLAKINEKDGTMHWKIIEKQKAEEINLKFPYFYRIWQPRVNPATVEITSYALLTYLMRGEEKLNDAVKIAKWLLNRRNSQGGFMSSQDTVVGITAMSKFAQIINTKENLESGIQQVKLHYGKGLKMKNEYNFFIGKENRTILQEYLLPGNTTEVEIEGEGKGTALAQLTWTYYVEMVDLSPAFKLEAKVTNERDQGRNIELEIRFAFNRTGKSNMAIIEAGTPSGYAFDQEELEILKKEGKFKRYELEDKDSKLQVYLEEVDENMKVISLKAYRIYLVAKHAKGVVKIYDYYDNTKTAQFMYDVPVITICDLCKMDKNCQLKDCQK